MNNGRDTIILIDDCKTFVMYLGILLRRMGFNVLNAYDGKQGLALLETVKPNLAFIDVQMPVMGGIETLKHIRDHEELSRIPVIMLSVDSNEETKAQCRELGCSEYLTKPLNLQSLHWAIQNNLFAPRGYVRNNRRITHTIKTRINHKGSQYMLFTETLSAGGMFLRMAEPLPVGSELKLEMEFNNGENITTDGTVIYVAELNAVVYDIPAGMGVKFNSISVNDSRIIDNYITRQLAADLAELKVNDVLTFDDEHDTLPPPSPGCLDQPE